MDRLLLGTAITRLHNGRLGLVEADEVRREFRAQHGEERGFQWKT